MNSTFKAFAVITTKYGTVFRSMRLKNEITVADMDIAMKRWSLLLKDEFPETEEIQITTEETGSTAWLY